MKNLMRIFSVFLIIAGLVLTIFLINLKGIENLFLTAFIYFATSNLLPFIAIAICAYCLEKNDTNYLLRIIPVYLTVAIIISAFIFFGSIESGFLYELYGLISSTFLEIIGLTLIQVIKPNNVISSFFKYLGYCLCAVLFILAIVLHFNNITTKSTAELILSIGTTNQIIKYYLIGTIAQIFTILILYITNYAFSDKVEIESADDVDFASVKYEAETLAKAQMNSIYNVQQKTVEQSTQSNNNGMMNINNQLGQNSNVGTVKEQAKTVEIAGSTLDSLIPLSKGPVINSTIQDKVEETIPPVEEKEEVPTPPVQTTLPPNLDIQEQMKLRMQQNNQNNNINQ